MRRVLLAVVVAGVAALPASTATAADIPPLNCGIVSCTYKIERAVQDAQDRAQECIRNTGGAVRNLLQGTPQPAVCNV